VKRLSSLIIGLLLVSSLLCGVWLVRLSVSDGEVVLYLQPEIINVEPGQIFTVNVSILNVQYLIKWIMGLSWNSSVVELEPASSSAVSEGPFMKSFGLTYFTVQPYSANSGYLCSVSCEFKQPTSASGSGILFFVRFKAKAKGETAINIVNSVLYDRNKQKISHTCKQAFVSSTSTIHDIAVSLEAPSTLVLGNSALINVTITNKGETDETDVKLNVLINGVSWQTQNLALLRKETAEKLTYLWKPSDKGSYNITVCAVPKPFEINIMNNYDCRIIDVIELVHDIAVSIEVPGRVVKGQTVNVSVIIKNVGGYDEKNIVLSISINNLTVHETTVTYLASGSTRTITYAWTLDKEGSYIITAFANSVNGETTINNNEASQTINVLTSFAEQKQILVVSGDTGNSYEYGTSLGLFKSVLEAKDYAYDVWVTSKNGTPSVSELLKYKVVIWTTGDYISKSMTYIEAAVLKQYLLMGGNILIEGAFLAYNNPPSYSDLRSAVLHVSFHGYDANTTGLTITMPQHPIASGLSLTANFVKKYRYGPDKVLPSGRGAFEIAKFIYAPYTGINVFDGTAEGIGSVVYFNFNLLWLPKEFAERLIENSIYWLMRKSISVFISKCIFAPENSVYFVYGCMNNADNEIIQLSGPIFYVQCRNSQRQFYDKAQGIIMPSGRVNSSAVNNSLVVLSGNPLYNSVVKYYESETDLPPVKLFYNNTHFAIINQKGEIVASLTSNDSRSELVDLFVMYTFSDPASGNDFFVIYGVGCRGELAAGIYFAQELVKNLPNYWCSWYIFKWQDFNGNALPESFEVTIESSG
jgi:archaellum component FlaF (FlaF/FlaG flagellin family)